LISQKKERNALELLTLCKGSFSVYVNAMLVEIETNKWKQFWVEFANPETIIDERIVVLLCGC